MTQRLGIVVGMGMALAVVSAQRTAHACTQASEAGKMIGWSADGKYGLFVEADDKGVIGHAEILPTTYQGSYWIIQSADMLADAEDGAPAEIVVSKQGVSECANFVGVDTFVERKKGTLTLDNILKLKTVAAMGFGTVEASAEGGADKPLSAYFGGAKRYDAHDMWVTALPRRTFMGAWEMKTRLAVPVYCMGACLSDEYWEAWSIKVNGAHVLASGQVIYDVTLSGNVCQGMPAARLISATPDDVKVPRIRCAD